MAEFNSKLREEILELREKVFCYKPGEASTYPERVKFPENLYIGIFGRTGCGKTSLINSMKFAARGRLRRSKWLTISIQGKTGGYSMFRILADITENIFVIDNRGLDIPNTEKVIAELVDQLDGKRGYGSKVAWHGEIDEDEFGTLDQELDPCDSGHPIGCAVIVLSARHDIDVNTTGLTEVIAFLHAHQGRYPVAVITHVDVVEKVHVETLRSKLRERGVRDLFEVANLTYGKPKLEDFYQLILLKLIARCMTNGDDTFMYKYCQKKEQKRVNVIGEKQKKAPEQWTLEQRFRAKGPMASAPKQIRSLGDKSSSLMIFDFI